MHISLPVESVYIDLSDRTKLRFTGADRVRFLNGQVSNDVRDASATRAIYTGIMTIKGKLCADAYLHAAPDALLLDAEPELREALTTRLERYIIADDVQIEDVTESLALLHLIDFAADAGTPKWPEVSAALAALGTGWWTVPAERFGRPGTDLFYEPTLDARLRHALHAGFTELNADAVEAWRITAGVPRWGAELDADTMPAEAGIEERAVSFTKGCYIGQEIVSRVKSVGRVNRHLRGLRALDSSPLFPGMELRAVSTEDPGDEPLKAVGQITSAAAAAGHGGADFIALGYVRRGSETPGTLLDAVLATPAPPGSDASSASEPGLTTPPCRVEVCALPFV